MQQRTTDSTPIKQCVKCEEWLPATPDYFHRSSKAKDGLKTRCKKCRSERPGGFLEPPRPGEKRCSKCRESKPLWEFNRKKSSRDGHEGVCRKCRAKRDGYKYRPAARPGYKFCSDCHQELPATLEYFGVDKRYDIFASRCKACARLAARKWAEENRERSRAKAREWEQNNPDRFRENQRRYQKKKRDEARLAHQAYLDANKEEIEAQRQEQIKAIKQRRADYARRYNLANAEKISETKKRYKENNREKIKDREQEYRRRNKERQIERQRKYRQENPEKVREIRRKYYQANPERTRAYALNRLARKRGAEGNHTAADIKRQYNAQCGKCYYCGIKVGKKYHVDHVVPLSRGGSNGPENIVIACPPCNVSKNNRLPHEWSKGNRLL